MTALEQAFSRHQKLLFGICYRMTGSAADAEDLVQETFRRALEAGGPTDGRWKPWLLTVATRLAIDGLRKRKRRSYRGPWLPAPVETESLDWASDSVEARYGNLESATFAFLLAVEALTPHQRAVLLLRDALGLTGAETAAILGRTEGSVRVALLRARRALEAYDQHRCVPTAEAIARTREALHGSLAALAAGDAAALAALLAPDVRGEQDADREFIAAGRTLVGRDEVVFVHQKISATSPAPELIEERSLNGFPAMVVRLPARPGRYATRIVLRVELDAAGRIGAVQTVLSTRKLRAISFDPAHREGSDTIAPI